MSTATGLSKGWAIIPVEFRERYGFKPNTRVRFIDYRSIVALVAEPQEAVLEGLGALKRFGKGSWAPTLLWERASEHKLEEIKIERRHCP